MVRSDLSLCNGKEAGQSSLRGEQIVVACVQAMFRDAVADREKIARLVQEEREIHFSQLSAAQRELFDGLKAIGGAIGSEQDVGSKTS